MNKKKRISIFITDKTIRKIFYSLLFIILFLPFSRILATAEADVNEKQIYDGGAVPFETESVKVEEVPEDISAFAELPERVNLSTSKYFPPIRAQQGNSCIAWATVYYQFTYEVARLNNWDAKHDDSKVFSPKYAWNYLNQGENNGISFSAAYNFLKSQGSLRWTEFPQNNLSYEWYAGANETETSNVLRNALKNRIFEYAYPGFADMKEPTPITGNKDSQLTRMKQLLNDGKVLCVATDCNVETTKNNKILSNGERGIISGEASDGGHAITIVGYDDTISYDLNGNATIEDFERGAFLVANSWGMNHPTHNNGYIWVMYDALNQQSNAANLNTSDRRNFVRSYQYWYITIKNYAPKRMVEVTLEQQYRNEFKVSLYTARTLNSPENNQDTFLEFIGGEKSFDGGKNGRQIRTFVFAYEDEEDIENKIFGIKVEDATKGNGTETTVKKIRWIDENGKVLKELSPQETFNFGVRPYFYGIPVKSITLNKSSSTLYKGESEELTATVFPENATEKELKWTSSNPKVVRVDDSKKGKVSYRGTGTAVVTATATDGSGVSASCVYQITDDYHDTYDKAFLVGMHSKTAGVINMSGDVDYFKFTPTTTGVYLIYTTGSTNTMGYLYDASQKLLQQNNDASLSGKNFALQYTLEAGKTYYIKVKGYSTATGAYTLNISKDFYGASLASYNQDARRVQMQGEAATVLTTLNLKIGSKTYILNRPAGGVLDTMVNGAHFKVTFKENNNNNGLSTIWIIEADIPATTVGGGDTISFDFSKGTVKNVKSQDMTGFIAYGSAIKTGVNTRASDSLKQLLAAMQQSGNTLTVQNWDNTLVNVTSITKAVTGMKIIETDSSGLIRKIHYLVVFGDVTGGTVNPGDGSIDSRDSLEVLKSDVELSKLGALAFLAADVDHDGKITSIDALLINKYDVGLDEIDQNYVITTVPDDCYYQNPVIF